MVNVSEISGPQGEKNTRGPLERFEQVVQNHPEVVALICSHQAPDSYGFCSGPKQSDRGSAKWTYAGLNSAVNRLCCSLGNLGLSDKCLLFVVLGNSVEHVITTLAAYRLGYLHVSIDPRTLLNGPEARHMVTTVLSSLRSFRVAVVVRDCKMAELFNGLFPHLAAVRIIIEDKQKDWISFSNLLTPGCCQCIRHSNVQPVNQDHRETSIFFSSGTTSLPKACMLDISSMLTAVESRISLASASPGSKVMVLVPISHAFGFMSQVLALTRGATLVYTSHTGFDPKLTIETMYREECSYLVLVSTLVHALIATDPSVGKTINPLKGAIFSGMNLSAAMAKQFMLAFRVDHIENIFGMMEGVLISTGPVENLDHIVHDEHLAVGVPTIGGRARICAPGNRSPLPRGIPGEVHYSGFQIASGYLGMESSDFYTDEDGSRWFNTGDQGVILASGQLYPVGRYKELIVRGGKNLSPAAIESTLNQIPEFRALHAQAIALPDSLAGEAPAIVVNQDVKEDQIRRIVHTILTSMGPAYVPTKVLSIQALGLREYPRTFSGKVQKSKLVALARKYEEPLRVENTAESLSDVRQSVVRIWADALGIPAADLDMHADVSERSDSITSMRIHARIQRDTGKEVSFAAWTAAKTIENLVRLVEDAPLMNGRTKKAPIVAPSRKKGPNAEEMVHVTAHPSCFQATRELVERTIAPHQLCWDDDVEDVFPTTDFMDIMWRNGIIQSWNTFISVLTVKAGVKELRSAIASTLSVHPLLRSFIVVDDRDVASDRALYVSIRASQKILDQCVVDYGVVDGVEDVKRLAVNYPRAQRVSSPGPLFRGLIVFVRETNSAALIGCFSHAVLDATYTGIFADDLDRALGGHELQPHPSFKAWADAHYLFGSSRAAQPALEFHTAEMEALRVQKTPTLWPPPGTTDPVPPERAEESIPLLQRSLPGIQALWRHHPDITSPVVLKVAFTLLTVHHSHDTRAAFLNMEAARSSFPFVPASLATEGSFSGVEVAGPTMEGILNVIDYDPDEQVIQLLRRVQEQQSQITKHAKVPWYQIFKTNPVLRDLFPAVAASLVFNWTGANTVEVNPNRNKGANMNIVGLHYRPTTGLMLDVGLSGKDGTELVAALTGALWDTSMESITRIADEFGRLATWIVDQDNWHRPVRNFCESLSMES